MLALSATTKTLALLAENLPTAQTRQHRAG
jgi:hypothetical protein